MNFALIEGSFVTVQLQSFQNNYQVLFSGSFDLEVFSVEVTESNQLKITKKEEGLVIYLLPIPAGYNVLISDYTYLGFCAPLTTGGVSHKKCSAEVKAVMEDYATNVVLDNYLVSWE